MANPSSIDGNPAVLLSGTDVASVTLNPQRQYQLFHDGEDASGTAHTDTIYICVNDGTSDPDASEGANKAKLKSGRDIVIGPGVTTLKFETAANDPTLTVVPGPEMFGDW